MAAALTVDLLTNDREAPVVPQIDVDGPQLVTSSPDAVLEALGDTAPESVEQIDVNAAVTESSEAGSGAFIPVDDRSDGGAAVGGATEASDGAEVVYPWTVEATGFAPEAPQPFAGTSFTSRFIDACSSGAAGCPFGVGGTVLSPGVSAGDFHIYGLTSVPDDSWDCRPVVVGDGAYPVLIVANQPARMQIKYYPVGQPALSQTAVLDLTDPGTPASQQFQAAVARGETPPAAGVHHCWVLRAQPGDSRYQVDVEGTGLEGDTDSYSSVVEVGGTRPPVWISARSDWELLIGVPVTSQPQQRSVVRVLYRNEELSCSDIEAATLADASTVVKVPSFGGYRYRDDIAEVIGTHDPAYDAYEYWSVSLQEGYGYLLCVWWVSTPGSDSFNPNSIVVDEREQRRIVAPDRYRPQVATIRFSAADLVGMTYTVKGQSTCREYPDGELIPSVVMRRGQSRADLVPVCSFDGVVQPSAVYLDIYYDAGEGPVAASDVLRVWIPTPPRPRCANPSQDPRGCWTGSWTVNVDGHFVEFAIHYGTGEDVTEEVTLSGFDDCNTGGVMTASGTDDVSRGTPSGGCASWLIGSPAGF